MAAKIKKGDKVVVLTGRDKGRSGEVIEVRPPTAARSCAASIWSSATSARPRSRKAASSPRRRRSTCPIWRSPIPRTASRRVLASSSWKGRRAQGCASRSVRESRSMADNRRAGKAEPKTEKSPRRARAEKAEAEGAAKAAAEAARAEKVPPRLRRVRRHSQAGRAVRLHNRCRCRRSTRSCSTWALAKASTTARRSTRPPPTRADRRTEAGITKSRKSIATFKLREGQAIGCKVTLRKARMYEFIDRLVNIALPRVRDFRG